MTTAYAPFDVSYGLRVPYISTTEYQNAPTAIDTTQLVPGNAAANLIALQELIGRASSWVDGYTCGGWGTLCATEQVENARVWGNRLGQLIVHPKYWPIIGVSAFSYSILGYGLPSNAASISPSGSTWIEPQQFIVQPQGTVSLGLNAPAGIGTSEYFCEWQYVAGWPNSQLAASVSAGATSIEPASVVGFVPGATMTLYDLPYDEAIQVSSSYTPGDAIVTLTSPLQYNHAATATATSIPPSVKQAAILATTAFIKQRGNGGFVVSDIVTGAVQAQNGTTQNSGGDFDLAKQLLDPLKVTFVGY